MKVKTTVTLPHSDLEWYQTAYPDATLSWVLSLLLHSFRTIHEDIGATPIKISRDSAKEVKEMIDDGIFKSYGKDNANS